MNRYLLKLTTPSQNQVFGGTLIQQHLGKANILYIADTYNYGIRKITYQVGPTITRLPSRIYYFL